MVRGRRGAALTVAALGLMPAALATAGEGRWTSQGPNAEFVSALAVDPSGRVVFAATIGSSPTLPSVLHRSLDGGADWLALASAPAGTSVASVAADPERPGVVYGLLSSGDFYESLDGGISWRLLQAFDGISGGNLLDPRDSRIIYILGSICPAPEGCGQPVTTVARVATIFRERPGQDLEMLPIVGATSVFSLAIDPTIPDRLYAGTDTGVWRSSDGGRDWEAAGRGTEFGCAPVSALAIGPTGMLLLGYFQHFYGFAECGSAYRSTDGAATWQPVRNLPYHALSFAFDPSHAGTAWAAASDFLTSGVYRSLDGGASWEPASEGLEGRTAIQLAVDSSGQRIYAATDAGVFDLEVPDSGRSVLPPASQRPATRSVGPRP